MPFAYGLYAQLHGARGGFDAGFDLEFAQDVFGVFVDGAFADSEDGCDGGVGFAFGDPVQNFGLAAAESKRPEIGGIVVYPILGKDQVTAVLLFENPADLQVAAVAPHGCFDFPAETDFLQSRGLLAADPAQEGGGRKSQPPLRAEGK